MSDKTLTLYGFAYIENGHLFSYSSPVLLDVKTRRAWCVDDGEPVSEIYEVTVKYPMEAPK